ncbi:GSCOCT00006873001.2-RA-CDS [Cotesia congregata]|uniref:CYP6BD15 n=1 Tax=Cotesia congregata TaxID=51543 RepID=A0A8J2HA32_COTCN|nr:GSCOCT00006873001.2-RA-CDS [Cotesia congregata]CAG5089462.1 CYP6BD15 [Cotesia congregata]
MFEQEVYVKFTNYIGIILATLLLGYLYCRYKLSYWKKRGVSQFRKTNLIFGDYKNGILFRTAPGYHLAELYHEAPENVPYIGFYIFHKPCLLLKDPNIIKQILFRDSENFNDRYFAGSPQKDSFGMKNLFGLKNPTWKYVWSKTVPSFGRKNVRQMVPLMMETGEPMMEFLRNEPANDQGVKIIDAQDLNYKYGADLIGNIALGVKTDSFKYPDSDYTKFLMSFFRGFKRMIALVTVFFIPKLVEIIGTKILFDSTFLQKVFQDSIKSREESGGKRGDYVDSIIELKNDKQSPLWKFEGENLFFQSGLFFSGLESSTTTATVVLMELAQNKDYQNRAREDVKKAVAEHGWTFEAFDNMKYLDLCIAEGVRLYPPVVHLDRYTRQDYKVPDTDLLLKKGTPIFVSVYGLHTDPKHFENPRSFIPERFSEAANLNGAYFPFGGGPRMCIGKKIGQMHVKVVLSKILSEYEIDRNPEEMYNVDRRSTFTASANGVNIELKPLKKCDN